MDFFPEMKHSPVAGSSSQAEVSESSGFGTLQPQAKVPYKRYTFFGRACFGRSSLWGWFQGTAEGKPCTFEVSPCFCAPDEGGEPSGDLSSDVCAPGAIGSARLRSKEQSRQISIRASNPLRASIVFLFEGAKRVAVLSRQTKKEPAHFKAMDHRSGRSQRFGADRFAWKLISAGRTK